MLPLFDWQEKGDYYQKGRKSTMPFHGCESLQRLEGIEDFKLSYRLELFPRLAENAQLCIGRANFQYVPLVLALGHLYDLAAVVLAVQPHPDVVHGPLNSEYPNLSVLGAEQGSAESP
jgi:hypothetical protein